MTRAKCPACGIPTIPDHQTLIYEHMLCEKCWEDECRDKDIQTYHADRLVNKAKEPKNE